MRYWYASISLMLLLFCIVGHAEEFQLLYKSPRAQAMGGAFTAVADDESAIYYNPAGLAGVSKILFHGLSANIEVSNDAVNSYSDLSNALSNSGFSVLNNFMGKNIYARAQASSDFVFPGFGVSVLYDQQLGVSLKNKALPVLSIQRQNTYGVQAAFGVPVLTLRKKKGQLRFGLAGKYLFRSGGYQKVSLMELLTIDSKSMINQLNSSLGSGYGLDSGVQFVYQIKKKLSLKSALAFKNIGDTSFSGTSSPIKSDLVFGLASSYQSDDMVATLAYDYSHILDYADWRKKNHFGLELKFPLLSLYGGVNQVYLTYGAGVDLWFIKVMYLSYAEEQATLVNQDPERRHLLHITLKLEI